MPRRATAQQLLESEDLAQLKRLNDAWPYLTEDERQYIYETLMKSLYTGVFENIPPTPRREDYN